MTIETVSEHRIRLHSGLDPAFAFDVANEASLSPFHLFAASLATCTFSVLHGWAQHAGLPLEGLEIGIEWEIGGEPVRVTEVRMQIHWPGLPDDRAGAARRVASHCTIHHTLEHGSRVATLVETA